MFDGGPVAPRPGRTGAATQRPGRWTPAEGWSVLGLHAVVVLAAALTMEAATAEGWAPGRGALVAAAIGGLAVGTILAKLRAPDLLAHLVAFGGGLLVIVLGALSRAGLPGDGWRGRLLAGWELVLAWTRALSADRPLDDPNLFAAIIALTLWLVAYASGWVLYRRAWLTTALLVPGIVVVVNLGYAPGEHRPLLLYVVASCLLAARHHLFRREAAWSRAGIERPQRLPLRFLSAGANLAILVAVLAWTLPLTAREVATAAVWERLEEPWGEAADRWREIVDGWIAPGEPGPGSYAAFDDAFRLGGELRLSDDPVAVLAADERRGDDTYLVGRRYNVYDGRGWSSDAAQSFDGEAIAGARYASEMSFAEGLGVHLSSGVTKERTTVGAEIRVIRPKGDLLLTTDTFLTADRRFDVELSWRQVQDERFDLRGTSVSAVLSRLPVDLRGLGSLVSGVDAGGDIDAASGLPLPADPAIAEAVLAERERLRGRFIDARWAVGPGGRIDELVVSGQLPAYDDVEAVSTKSELGEGATYGVTGLASTASPEALRQAGTAYPAWVTDRYLGLPDSVTERTRALAAQVAAGSATPFDVASKVEAYVRSAIRYEEEIEAPPAGRDVVDYVLFESKEGYCEYYASAMAVMLRSQGIPARVVGGYFPAPYDAAEAGFLYREKNAHLWVEAFFPGYGWIPFEPTASQDRLSYGDRERAPLAEASPTPEAGPTEAEAAAPPNGGEGDGEQGERGGLFAGARSEPGWLIGGFVSLGLLAAAAAIVVWQWGLRGLGPAGGVYARALRLGRWAGVEASPATTPREYAERLGRAVPAARRPALLVSDAYSQEVYAERPADPDALRRARSAWAEVRRILLRRFLGRRTSLARRRTDD